MARLPHFQENGRFSLTRYRAMDNNTRMTLWRQVQENYIVDHYMADLASLQTPSGEVSFVSSMGSRQRTFDLAIFPLASFPYPEIASFAEANADLFRVARVSSITVDNEREARQLFDSVRSGNISFEEAAQNYSHDWAAGRSGYMGSFMSFELTWIIGNEDARLSVFNLPAGGITEVFRVPAGWAFYRVEEAAHQADVNDPDLQNRIRGYFTQNMRGRIEDWAISEAERFSALAREV
jgi:hypothetical protein